MNPFDLPGPQFLMFYLVFGLAVLLVGIILRRNHEGTDGSTVRLMDPYLVAYLRGGKDEALGVAAASLLDRKLLTGVTELSTVETAAADLVRRPIEKSILERFKTPDSTAVLFTDRKLAHVADEYEHELTRLHLMPDDPIKSFRDKLTVGMILILWGTAITKIVVALGRGRTNILFLIITAIVFAVTAYIVMHPRRTRAGDLLLEDMKTLFAGLKGRASSLSPGGKSNEAAFLAAVFGLAALPGSTFPFASRLKPRSHTSASTCSSWTSSCSTSSSSSCGSSCGGGCGGGCGGCGS